MKKNADVRRKAYDMFVESDGKLTNYELAKKLDKHRGTIGEWRTKDRWDERLEEIRRQAVEAAEKRIVTKRTESIELLSDKTFANLEILSKAFTNAFIKKRNGEVVRDENGVPLYNTDLKPSDLAHLAKVQETIIKIHRLLTGQSTDNQSINQRVSGQIDHVHTTAEGTIEQAARAAIIPGNEGLQKGLFALAEQLQHLRQAVKEGS